MKNQANNLSSVINNGMKEEADIVKVDGLQIEDETVKVQQEALIAKGKFQGKINLLLSQNHEYERKIQENSTANQKLIETEACFKEAEMGRKEAETKWKEVEEERDVLIAYVKEITSKNNNLSKDNKRLSEEIKSKDDKLFFFQETVDETVKIGSELKKIVEPMGEKIKVLSIKMNRIEDKIDEKKKKKNAFQRLIARFHRT